MKKNLLTIILTTVTIFIAANANAQQFRANIEFGNRYSNQQAFYFYPASNVYFNMNSNEYVYQRRNGAWTTGYRLPERFRIANTQRFTVYHNGMDVWAENRMHIDNFQRYGRPEVAYRGGYYSNGYKNECR